MYTPVASHDYKEYAVWLVTIILVAVGFRYAKEVIVFLLDKLYEVFIQNNPVS